jgi:hypothetical protein
MNMALRKTFCRAGAVLGLIGITACAPLNAADREHGTGQEIRRQVQGPIAAVVAVV